MTRLRRFVLVVAVAIALVISVAVYVISYVGFAHVSRNAATNASQEVADAAVACALGLMAQGMTRAQLDEQLGLRCGTNGEGSLGSHRNYDLRVIAFGPGGRPPTPAELDTLDEPMATAFRTGQPRSSTSGVVLSSAFPVHAHDECLKCHTAAHRDQVLGVVTVMHDMGPELAEGRRATMWLLFLITPLPILGAVLSARLIARRVRRSIRSAERRLDNGVHAAELEPTGTLVDFGFVEFNELYHQLVEKLERATWDLGLHVDVLSRLRVSPEAGRNWRREIARLLLELHGVLAVDALALVFVEDDRHVRIELFWRATPAEACRGPVLAALRAALQTSAFAGLAEAACEHTIADREGEALALQRAPAPEDLRLLIGREPAAGGVIGSALLVAEPHLRTARAVESTLAALLGVGGAVKAMARYTTELEYHTARDPLTELYNHRLFWELLGYDLSRAERHRERCGLIIVDLDRMKAVNDAHGQAFGDTFLREAARTFAQVARESDVLARCGGDELALSMYGAGVEQAFLVARRIAETFRTFRVTAPDGTAVGVTASVGVAVFPEHGRTPKELFGVADAQMYKAKARGRDQVSLPTAEDLPEAFDLAPEKGALIRAALAHDWVVPYFQPLRNVRTRTVEGHEVLLRLVRPEGKVVMAAEVIEIAEAMGLVTALDLIILDKALARARERRYPGRLFVNLSSRALVTREFVADVTRCVKRHEIDPQKLVFELREREVVRNLALVERFARELVEEGFGFAIDDFGVSAAQYLRRVPVALVKIAPELIGGLTHPDGQDRAMVRGICTFAQALGIRTVAKAVEDATSLPLLDAAGVELAQGFHVGQPVDDLIW